MIPLRLSCSPMPISEPLVFRLRTDSTSAVFSESSRDAWITKANGVNAEFDLNGFGLSVKISNIEEVDRDVVLLLPRKNVIHRLIRAKSQHNTLLITERCDQKCIMCSQPPKDSHIDMFGVFKEALDLAPRNTIIGLSGGEPLLFKSELFNLLEYARIFRQDISFHILTNGRAFTDFDAEKIESIGVDRVLWGVPIYAARPEIHDAIVGVSGAFEQLTHSLATLARTGARIEIRTVIMNGNIEHLEDLASFIARKLPFIDVWAIMQMENIGYGRMVWRQEFFDSSLNFDPIARAIDTVEIRGVSANLYNFPICTIPTSYRAYAVNSISDWKQKFLSECSACVVRSDCCGLFEWHPKDGGYNRLGLL
ncbi:His-Xaa-Ser system radical SAM maturase HxsC [Rhodovulum sulfidophilum]|uniref:His-Xaa-Ser system radical SAM maturase HxsC n=3 Tax=Rhodovulum visakhapatnamense TaxID=364297 RepID=A0ABS1RNI0_9RHOB|nr:His-Xaa-Ser system radical SAM maturase HxsC [Rhodovulum visakhapatnamense]MBL3580231.1 His-Xaa-Ser system radical SAM maturase HxsC [Rhodovulum visakhapatnamense]OLS46087.1 His-Xaa-Ser system radical SAM maturase HxsC [Rhodovulum sulfidophilum]